MISILSPALASSLTLVTGASIREVIDIDGQQITLRPLTFGEAGAIAQEQAMELAPSAAIVAEAVRDALREADLAEEVRARHIAAIDEHEAADEAVAVVHMARPMPQEPPEASAAYRAEMALANARVLAASRHRQIAEWLVRDSDTLTALRSLAEHQHRTRGLRLLAQAIEGWVGDDLPEWPANHPTRLALLVGLPAPWLNRLLSRAMALTNPGIAEAKN